MSPVSQVAARADGQGRLEDGRRSSRSTPRTPAGPSDVIIGRSPSASAPCVRQLSAPVSRSTFSCTGSPAISPAIRLVSALVPGAALVVSGLAEPAVIAGSGCSLPSGAPPGR
jgi:hypothetical protein